MRRSPQCPEGEGGTALILWCQPEAPGQRAVIRSKSTGPISSPWPSQLKGDLGLMSSCLQGHGGSQHPSVLLDGTLDIARWFMRVQTGPGPMTFQTTFKRGTLRFLIFERLGSLGRWPVKRPSPASGIFVFRLFISPMIHLKGIAKTSAYGVRGSFLDV